MLTQCCTRTVLIIDGTRQFERKDDFIAADTAAKIAVRPARLFMFSSVLDYVVGMT